MIKVASIQMKMSSIKKENILNAKNKVTSAAKNGAEIILLPELFESIYFCKDMNTKYFSFASPLKNNQLIKEFSDLSLELGVIILVSYFEEDANRYYNSLVVIDKGNILENYRKTHIPDGVGYEEKFYFTPGDTGFKVWQTSFGKIGAGICWDQWFPECARCLTLMGAELIFYPTAIGSEPEINIDSKEHWQRVQMGHSAANMTPVIVANRIGVEDGDSCSLTFYGSSFMTNNLGEKIAEASRDKEEILYASYDLEKNEIDKEYWALFKDRRGDIYKEIVKT